MKYFTEQIGQVGKTMKILLTGTTGYIGKRLLPALLNAGHHVVCCVRDRHRFDSSLFPEDQTEVIEVDFLKEELCKIFL
jgi:nucleoside-diphosphate-sugar epimerase